MTIKKRQPPEFCYSCGRPYDPKYFNTNQNCCKRCRNEYYKQRIRKIESGEFVPKTPDKPGEYLNNQDFEDVKTFLEKIGWIYDKDTNTFYKPGLKEKDGTWTKINKNETLQGLRRKLTGNLTNNVFLMKKGGYTYKKISKLLNISVNMAWRIINQGYGDKLNNRK